MSKASVRCSACGYRWTYSGVSCESCFCPRCGHKEMLRGPNKSPSTTIIEDFGFGD